MTGIKANGIKHCYRAEKRKRFLSQVSSLAQGLIHQTWMGSHLEKSKDRHKMSKTKMAALFGRKLIISVSILLTKPCLGSKLGVSECWRFNAMSATKQRNVQFTQIFFFINCFHCRLSLILG